MSVSTMAQQLRRVEAAGARRARHDRARCPALHRCRCPAAPRAASGPRRSRRDDAPRRPGPPRARRPGPVGVTARRPHRRPGAPGRAGTRAAPRSERPSAGGREGTAQRGVAGDAETPGPRGPLRAGVGDPHPRSGHDLLAGFQPGLACSRRGQPETIVRRAGRARRANDRCRGPRRGAPDRRATLASLPAAPRARRMRSIARDRLHGADEDRGRLAVRGRRRR